MNARFLDAEDGSDVACEEVHCKGKDGSDITGLKFKEVIVPELIPVADESPQSDDDFRFTSIVEDSIYLTFLPSVS